jgi:hypothetical protein
VRKGMFTRIIFEKRITKYEGRQNALLLRTSSTRKSYFVTLSLHPPFVMSPPSAHTTSRPTRGLTTRLKNPGFFRAAARPLAERDCAQAKGPIVRKGMFKRMIFEKRLTKYEGRQNALLLRTSSTRKSYFVTLSVHPPSAVPPPSAHTTSRPARGLTVGLKNNLFSCPAAAPLQGRHVHWGRGRSCARGCLSA